MSSGDILIVDDNPAIVHLLGNVLREAGYGVRVATEGARALQIAARAAPDLVLLDLRMPGLDGYQVCQRLKQDEGLRGVPVVVISALDDLDDKVRAFECGAADYVTKPFEPREVLARVGAHVQLYRLRRELERQQAALAQQNQDLQRKNEELAQAERQTRHVFSALASALPGTVLDGKYRLQDRIGVGGFASVFRAEQLDLRRPVAVKVFRPWEGSDSPQQEQRFRAEGVAACRIQHPNAVTVYDFGICRSGIAYLVMELLEGATVAELLGGGALPVARCLQVMVPVCEVLAAAHAAGLVHRDIKPENVFLQRTPRGEVVKVLDFGIARLLEQQQDAAATQTRGIVGTPAYMAPERVLGLEYDGRADVYSAGVMLHTLLSGRHPFPVRGEGRLWSALIRRVTEPLPPLELAGLPLPLGELVARTLAKDAEDRPTAAELAAELAQLARSRSPEGP